jgi:purine-binding chemotaxis protein CheW
MPQQVKPERVNKVAETTLAESDEAIYNLLESLLEEVDSIPAVRTETAEKKVTRVKTAEPVAGVATPQPVKVKVSTPEPIVETKVEEQSLYPEFPLPDWAGSTISCLLCDINGVEIAVPLLQIRAISTWDMRTLPMPAQPDWHLGVVDYRGEKIIIADTARLIMPEKMPETPEQRRAEHPANFIVINDRLALSCDAIKETIKLEPQAIRWRPKRPSRTWAMGTLIDRLCILLDTRALTEEIEQV